MKYCKTTAKYNCGIDLHTRCMYICVMDLEGNMLAHRNIKHNDFGFFLKLVEPYRHDLTVACERCFVCFWLADACEVMAAGSLAPLVHEVINKARSLEGGFVYSDGVHTHRSC
jgi:hypothetical protein